MKIFYDMDGVLADFQTGAQEQLGIDVTPFNRPTRDLSEALQALKRAFYDRLAASSNFYLDLPPYPSMVALYEELQHIPHAILTSVPAHPAALGPRAIAQKRQWLREHLTDGATVEFIAGKGVFKGQHVPAGVGGPAAVLVDDRPANVEDWEKAGGVGLLHTPGREQESIARLRQLVKIALPV